MVQNLHFFHLTGATLQKLLSIEHHKLIALPSFCPHRHCRENEFTPFFQTLNLRERYPDILILLRQGEDLTPITDYTLLYINCPSANPLVTQASIKCVFHLYSYILFNCSMI